MKQVCAASPGKFASALLDILDGSVEDSILPLPVNAEASPEKKGSSLRKRPAAAVTEDFMEMPAKKMKFTVPKIFEKPAKQMTSPKKVKETKVQQTNAVAQRRKELRAIKLPRLKQLVLTRGLEVGSKETMVNSILALEAKSRENIRKHKANVRDVVGQKREEFNGKTNKQLKELLQAYACQTSGAKPERVDRLLATWKEQGEIEKVLAGMAFRARKVELNAMDKVTLYELCRKKGVDALSKEILVERLLVHDSVEIWQEVMEARRH